MSAQEAGAEESPEHPSSCSREAGGFQEQVLQPLGLQGRSLALLSAFAGAASFFFKVGLGFRGVSLKLPWLIKVVHSPMDQAERGTWRTVNTLNPSLLNPRTLQDPKPLNPKP